VGSTAYANGGKCESEPIRSQQLWSECSRLLANCIIYYNACIQSELLERAERRQDTKGRRDQASEPGKLEACEPLRGLTASWISAMGIDLQELINLLEAARGRGATGQTEVAIF
jgi:Tn3 transposase DDE domain